MSVGLGDGTVGGRSVSGLSDTVGTSVLGV